MAIVRPFKGLRPVTEHVKDVASPPYDVLNSAEARKMAEDKPYTFLHVIKPEIDLPVGADLYDDAVYAKGRENLERLIRDQIMVQDDKPCFYLYQQSMGYHNQVGLVCCASIEDYENDVIRKHEHTRRDKENDRIRHVDTLNANTGPVFLTYRANAEMNDLAAKYMERKPLYDFVSEDGIWHTLWSITDEALIKRIENLFAAIPVLYVADGHHRSASGTKVGQRRREANPNHTGDEEYNSFLSVIFPHDQMYIMDYNRVVKDLCGMNEQAFLDRVKNSFDVKPVGYAFAPEHLHEFGMYLGGRWYKLTAKPSSFPQNDPVASLDVAILQNNLLSPILDIGDPRKDKRIDFVGGIRGLDELERRVNEGEAVAFSMFPTSIEQLMAIADAGEVMPPKSTWFEPKLRSGILVHLLD
ncbi:MAG: DUF1015 family protein [Candidatus Cloacimonetes bacterium]|nr:DUF1015 family protein [Candidatus Cloacimonadota bacterium]